MTTLLSDEQVRFLRLRAQYLVRQASDAPKTVAEIVRDMGGIQAQETAAAALALRVRGSGLLMSDVECALVQERSIVRTWGPRGTLHFLPAEDLGWLLPLLGPVFIASNRRRREELGLDEETCERGMRLLGQILAAGGPLTRAEIVEQLALRGLNLEGQARPHLLMRAALEGLICFGPDSGAEPTYVLLNDWLRERLSPMFSPEQACAELARRYVAAYGPVTPHDFAAWSGLALSQVRQTWQLLMKDLVELQFVDGIAWMLKDRASWLDERDLSFMPVRLLPRFDLYLLGYQKRNLILPDQYAKRVNAGGGMIHPTVLVDGQVTGTWKSIQRKHGIDISIDPFEALSAEIYPELEVEAAEMARFLGMPHSWKLLT